MIVEVWRDTLVRRLQQDAGFRSLIGVYGELPAVFGFEPVPEKTSDPWVVVPGIDISIPESDKTQARYEFIHTLEVWSRDRQDPKRVDRAADYLCLMLHRAKLTVPGVTVHSMLAELPINLDADGFIGRGVTVTTVLHRGED